MPMYKKTPLRTIRLIINVSHIYKILSLMLVGGISWFSTLYLQTPSHFSGENITRSDKNGRA